MSILGHRNAAGLYYKNPVPKQVQVTSLSLSLSLSLFLGFHFSLTKFEIFTFFLTYFLYHIACLVVYAEFEPSKMSMKGLEPVLRNYPQHFILNYIHKENISAFQVGNSYCFILIN